MLLSIVVTAYNSNDTISKCLERVLESSSDRFELIVVDDCSDKSSAEIVQGFGDKRVRYIYNNENLGPGLSRNVGIDNLRGQFVTFLDADDWYEHGAVDYILEQISSRSFDLLVFDFSTVYSSGCVRKQWRPSSDGAIKDFLCDRLISTVWNKVYRVDVIFDNNIRFPAYLSEDSLFNFKFLLRCKNVSKFDSFIYFFDKSGESLTKSAYSIESFYEAREALRDMEAVLNREPVPVKLSLRECFELRRFLFLFKDPVLRLYRDWLLGRIDRLVLNQFRNACEFSLMDLSHLSSSGLLKKRDLFAFVVFRTSPRFLFILMKLSKTT